MLRVEKNLSTNSISAYKTDLIRYIEFLYNTESIKDLNSIRQIHIRNFIRYLNDKNLSGLKVKEEIAELIEAMEKNTNKVHESADVLYHLLVYLEANDIKIEEVMKELEKRKK
mgnify:CR=1 FL=1